MDKRKSIAIIISVILTGGFYFLYTNSIIYWDAYAYEVFVTDEVDTNLTLEVTSAELTEYPLVEAVLEEAHIDGWAMASFEDGSLYEFDDFFTSRGENLEAGYVFLDYEDEYYEVSFTMYGGMDDEPIFLGITYLAAFAAIVLILSEAVVYLRKRN